MITTLRSALFAALALLWTAVLAVVLAPLAPLLPRRRIQRAAGLWCRGLIALVGLCCGLRWRLVGRENLPKGPAVLAVKHQSAWDTLIFHVLLNDPVYILKRELLSVPVLGFFLARTGNVAIDRGAGAAAIRTMLPRVRERLAEGAQVIVFPEGTRSPPGTRRRYQPGIAALYALTDAPVIPVALNSGLWWGRQSFLKYPGLITLEALPALPRGLDRSTFLAELEHRIEAATERLVAEAEGGIHGPEPGQRRPSGHPPERAHSGRVERRAR